MACDDDGGGGGSTGAEAPAAAWVVGDWSPCDAPCGGGNRTRSVSCASCAAGGGGAGGPADEAACRAAAARPAGRDPCNGFACAALGWAAEAWSACEADAAAAAGGDPCAAPGERRRGVSCESRPSGEGPAAVDGSFCAAAGLGPAPAAAEACTPDGCGPPETARPCSLGDLECSGRGACDAVGQRCVCDAGFAGAFCQSTEACAVLDAAGACCPSGALTVDGTCCAAPAPALSPDGLSCCAALSPCGACLGPSDLGDGGLLSLGGACCGNGTVLGADGECCPAGFTLDACGVCGGGEQPIESGDA